MSIASVIARIVLVLVMLFGAAGCKGDAERAGADMAAATAGDITYYLQNHVVTPGASERRQLGAVRRWLADPSDGYLNEYPEPMIQVLADGDHKIEIAVYDYGETPAIDGKDGAWGIACRRYTVDASGQLQASSFACPSSLPSRPPY
ncbi:MAG: hypothetical protein QM655_02265 [Nocardioidaceae bacterium]